MLKLKVNVPAFELDMFRTSLIHFLHAFVISYIIIVFY